LALGGLRPGKYVLDFRWTGEPRDGYCWVLPKPAEVDLRQDTRVALELTAVKPVRVDGILRFLSPVPGGAADRSLQCLDVTAGSPETAARCVTDKEGRFSLVLPPKRIYKLIVGTGIEGKLVGELSEAFAAEDYAGREFVWNLASKYTGVCTVKGTLIEKGARIPFPGDLGFSLKGEKGLSINTSVAKGQFRIPVFRDMPEGPLCMAPGSSYTVTLSPSSAQDFYVAGPDRFTIPPDLRGDFVFEYLLGRKPEVSFACVDSGTGREIPAFQATVTGVEKGSRTLLFRYPRLEHYPPLKVAPGKYRVVISASGYRPEQVDVDVTPDQPRVATRIQLAAMGTLVVRVRVRDGQPPACNLELYYLGEDPRQPAVMTHADPGKPVSIAYDNRRRAVVRVEAANLAPSLVLVDPGAREVAVEMSSGVRFEADVRLEGQPLTKDNRGGLLFVALSPARMPYERGIPRDDGSIAVSLLPGDYGVYLITHRAIKTAFHLGNIKIEKDTKRAYHIANLDELKPKGTRDPFKAPGE